MRHGLGAVTVEAVGYPRGYGYAIRPAVGAAATRELGNSFVEEHRADIEWVITEFGSARAVDLELVSTIVYVDREWRQSDLERTVDDLASQVREIKGRFTRHVIQQEIARLAGLNLLTSVALPD